MTLPDAASSNNPKPARIYLSPPHMGDDELKLVQEVFESNWIAPLGPAVNQFEVELANWAGVKHAAALSSGTAAMHLALRLLGLQRGEEVLCSSFTFIASASPIIYEGGVPVFIDSEASSWNLDPDLLREELSACAQRGKLPRAVISVDLYGQCADYDRILAVCNDFEVPLLEDAAEALGATYKGQQAGSFGRAAAFSFNGNKIITTSGGGMLASDDEMMIEKARFYATQARDEAPHYQHSEIGYNYRMSNILAAIGLGQLRVLQQRIDRRREIFEFYSQALGDLPGVQFMPIAAYGKPNYWLTCLTIDPAQSGGVTREKVWAKLNEENIESRPLWKPLHMQPVFEGCRMRGGVFCEMVFAHGLCLPSGTRMAPSDLERIANLVRQQW